MTCLDEPSCSLSPERVTAKNSEKETTNTSPLFYRLRELVVINRQINKTLDKLKAQAVEVTPVMYHYPVSGGQVVGVTNKAIPLEALNQLREELK